MSIENARNFYQRITTDEAFLNQLQSVASEERTTMIQAAGYNFTTEEWNTVVSQVSAAVERSDELDETELETVAGGAFINPIGVAAYGIALPPDLRWPFNK